MYNRGEKESEKEFLKFVSKRKRILEEVRKGEERGKHNYRQKGKVYLRGKGIRTKKNIRKKV